MFVIAAMTAAVSYAHEYQLARVTGRPAGSHRCCVTVDGLALGASVVLLWAAANVIERPCLPFMVLLAGIAATTPPTWPRD